MVNPWNYEAEIEAGSMEDAIDKIRAEDGNDCFIDGIIRRDILEDFDLGKVKEILLNGKHKSN